VAATALAGAAWVVAQVPLPAETPQAETTILYDAGGAQLAVLHGSENRVAVSLNRVPPVVQHAVVALEDRNFFHHGGVDPLGIARATWADVRHRSSVEGGSTITQQYVKNVFVGNQRSLARKLKEAVISVKREGKYDKKAILERYLNTIYFGRGAYGVQAASRAYFAKDVDQLGVREASYLAGLIRSPVMADVARDAAAAAAARSRALDAMVNNGYLRSGERTQVEAIPIPSYVVPPSQSAATVALAGKGTEYFVDYVRQKLSQTYGETRVLRGGLRVETSLDLKLQEQAYNAVYGLLNRPADPAGALVALDPDGHVVAMVGGRNFADSPLNLAVGTEGGGGGRQGGSAFKPFVLAETVREGYTVESSFAGPAKIVIPKADNGHDWSVANFENESFDRLNLIEATAKSVNTIYAQLVSDIGPDRVVGMAHQLGIRSALRAVPSITLGTQEVSVKEMADAYLTFANEGVQTDARVIRRVLSGGSVLLDDKPRRTRVLERSQADVVNFALRQVVDHGTGVGAKVGGRNIWGKTGTTEDNGDAWFCGFTPKLTAAVWMGYPEGQSRSLLNVHGVAKVNGGSLPATIFQRFMSRALVGNSGQYPVPASFPGRLLGSTRVAFGDSTSTTSLPPAGTTTLPAPGTTAVPTTSPPGRFEPSTVLPTLPPIQHPTTTKPPPTTRAPPTTFRRRGAIQ